MDEQVFIRVYMEITGESEGRARAAAMYMDLYHHPGWEGWPAATPLELPDAGTPGTTDPGGPQDLEG